MKKHGPMDRTERDLQKKTIQQVSKKRKDLHGSLAPWPFVGHVSSWGHLEVATPRGKSQESWSQKNETGNAGVSYERWGMRRKNDTFKTSETWEIYGSNALVLQHIPEYVYCILYIYVYVLVPNDGDGILCCSLFLMTTC